MDLWTLALELSRSLKHKAETFKQDKTSPVQRHKTCHVQHFKTKGLETSYSALAKRQKDEHLLT